MNENDSEETFCHFGTALDIVEEDEEVTRRRKLPVDFRERVLDEKGRPLRFHGAFTGGFSAGHFNTVGTQDGFMPSSFISSRKRTSESGYIRQKPEDFMDESDFSDFGIAPRSVRIANKFDSSEFNCAVKKSLGSIGTISSSYKDPLKDIIAPKMATVSQRLIKRMFRSDDKTEDNRDSKFTPDKVNIVMYTTLDFTTIQKENTYGLGYKPLTSDLQKQNDQSSHLCRAKSSFVDSLFPQYKSIGRGIRGSGFGVGIQEEQDEDVYHTDDWSNYDFSITSDASLNEHSVNERSESIPLSSKNKCAISMFKVGSTVSSKSYPLPHLPRNFNPVFKKPTAKIQNEKPVPVHKPDDAKKSMTEWEKPLEKKATLPSWVGHLSKKFHSVGADESIGSSQKPRLCLDEPKVLSERDLAVKMQNYGLLTRSIVEWRPDNLLCKRFNVPNPYPDSNFTGVPSDNNKGNESFNVSNPTFSLSKMIQENTQSSTNTNENQSKMTEDEIPCPDTSQKPEIQKSAIAIKPSIRKGSIFSVLFDNSDTSEKTVPTSIDVKVTEDLNTATPVNEKVEEESNSAPVGVPSRPVDLFKSIFASDDDSDYSESEEDKDDGIEAEILSKMSGPQIANNISSAVTPGSDDPSVNESVNRILSAVNNSANINNSKEDSSSDLEFVEVTKSSLMLSSKASKSKAKRKKNKKHKKEKKKKKKRRDSSSDSN